MGETAAAEGQQGIEAADANPPLDAYFDNFSVRNWNQDPYRTNTRRPIPHSLLTPQARYTIKFFGPDESQIEENLGAAVSPLLLIHIRYACAHYHLA